MDYQQLFGLIPKEPRRWTAVDVEQWLNFIGLGGLNDLFLKNAIDGACLEVLNEADLNELGIESNLKRKKLLQWIQMGFGEYKLFVRGAVGQSDWSIISKKVNKENQMQFPDNNIDNLEYTPIQKLGGHRQMDDSFANHKVEMVESMRVVEAPMQPQQQQQQYNPPGPVSTPVHQTQSLEVTKLATYPCTQQKQPMKYFEIVSHNDNKHIKVDENGLTIGRSPDCKLVLSEDYVSRVHCSITYEKGQFYLTDQGSTSGTFILLVAPSLMRVGFILHMGSNQYRIQSMDVKNAVCELVLRVVEGEQRGQKFCVSLSKNESVLKFGRHLDQFKNDTHLSTHHAQFSYCDDGVVVQDLDSRNGVWLRLSEAQKQSDRIRLTQERQFRLGYEKVFDCQGL